MNRILFVEDNPCDREIIIEYFESKKHNVSYEFAENSEQIYDLFYKQNFRPDIIIMDINLPIENGKDILNKLKKDNKFKYIPILIFSTSNFYEDIYECYSRYATAYLVKPLRYEDFEYIFDRLIEFWFKNAVLPTKYILDKLNG